MQQVINGLPFDSSPDKDSDYVKPFWSIEFEDEETFLKWAKEAIQRLEKEHLQRTYNDLRNEKFYEGYQSRNAMKSSNLDRDFKPTDSFSKVIVNQVFELTEQKVSKMTRFAPAIAVLPQGSEYSDKVNARLAKAFVDHQFDSNEVDEKLEDIARKCRLNGEVFCAVEYDYNRGDYISPEAASNLDRVPVYDSMGNQVFDENNDPIYVQKADRIGDVNFRIVLRRYLLREPQESWGDVNWTIEIKTRDISEMRAQYPDLADKIKSGTSFVSMFQPASDSGQVIEYIFHHKGTKFLSKGRKIVFTSEVVLENTHLPYSDLELPYIRLSDIDIPGDQYGKSFIDQILLLQIAYNNLISIQYTNASLGSHLYWLVPKQAGVEINKIRNSNSVIQYNAGFAPTLQQFRTVGGDLFQLIEFVNQALLRTSAIQDISRGEVPTGIEAGVALAFLEEQENQRANTDIKKHNKFIQKLAKKAIGVAGDYYKPEQPRTIRIIGKDNSYVVKTLDKAKLSSSYDIRVVRTTALSESKSGRISQILAIESRFPNMVPREQVMDMLELSNDKKYYALTTVAVQTSEKENEDMSEGKQIPAAQPFEELQVHWYSHVKFMQSAEFKEFPPKIKELFIDHVRGTEFLIFDRMAGNPVFKQMIATTYPSFPCLLTEAAYMSAMAPSPVSSGITANGIPGSLAPMEGNLPLAPNLGAMVGGSPTGDIQSLQEPLEAGQGEQGMEPAEGGESPNI